jgi:hypothetical protein
LGQSTQWAGWQEGDRLDDVNADGVLSDLIRVAGTVGLEVRSQALRGTHPSHGGLCRLPGRVVVFLSSKATPLERCTVLAQALAELGHAAHPELAGESRALVERRGRPLPAKKPAHAGATRPGLAGLGGDGRRR